MDIVEQMKVILEDAAACSSVHEYISCGRRAAAILESSHDFGSIDDVSDCLKGLELHLKWAEATLNLFV